MVDLKNHQLVKRREAEQRKILSGSKTQKTSAQETIAWMNDINKIVNPRNTG